ncbi:MULTISPECIES: hypothetical protein [Yersinia]|uniref:hypothetical protein n=1 Tax=Yersinia TaxID=629 RepID=UPI001C60C233|nr:hypothetical protein [Yersinia kristensenii]MBW5814203.1 hypothetical protein [Yersinia kristensenii]MBW5831391.1 hypothetical protein [Yersinia kristensenii]
MLIDSDILDTNMAEIIAKLGFSDMNTDDCLQLADHCCEANAGLCQCLNYLGDSLVTFADHNILEFTSTSLGQLGHSLMTISSLIPALTQLEQLTRADIQNMGSQPTDICL